jgi:hypothetical protein
MNKKMVSLERNKDADVCKPVGFLERQFQQSPTLGQKKFDWTFGVVLPIVCIAADPLVFRSSIGLDRPLLEDYKVFAYVLSSASIMAMAAWLLWGNRLGEFRGYVGGFFLVASAVSFMVGVILLPYSILGTIILIGLLGFTPLFSGFVFFRNATRVIDSATDSCTNHYVCRAATIGALYGFVFPLVLN